MLFGLEAHEYASRGLLLLLAVYCGTLLFAAVTAWPVYWLVGQWAAAYPSELALYLADKDFHDYVDRLRMLPVIIALPWLFRRCGLASWRALGVQWDMQGLQVSLRWFAVAVLVVGVIALEQVFERGAGLRDPVAGAAQLWRIFGLSLLSGAAVALVEETVFRGMILRMFYTRLTPFFSVLLASLFFAYTHFSIPDKVLAVAGAPSFGSGFFVAYGNLFGITKSFELIPFLNLTLLGTALSLLVLRTGSLMPAIGFHAGAVCFISSYRQLVQLGPAGSWEPFLGGTSIKDGWLTSLVLGLMVAALLFWPKREIKEHGA